jgi:hypothetical protein
MPDHPRGVASNDREGLNIPRHNGTSANDRTLADPPTLKHKHSLPHPCKVFDHGNIDWRRAMSANWLT